MEISRSLESDKKRPSRRARALQFAGSFQFAFLCFPPPWECYLLIYFASHFGGRRAGSSFCYYPAAVCVAFALHAHTLKHRCAHPHDTITQKMLMRFFIIRCRQAEMAVPSRGWICSLNFVWYREVQHSAPICSAFYALFLWKWLKFRPFIVNDIQEQLYANIDWSLAYQ
jgi:hypothetical protein